MKKCEFSEKNYEILFLHEFLNHFKGADLYSPSQYQEKQFGYDALFKNKKNRKLIALQFKIVKEYIKRPDYLCQSSKCFKFDLHLDSKTKKYIQHNALVSQNKECLAGYIVPYFNSYLDLHYYSKNNILIDNSFMIIPTKEVNDIKSHYINFDDNIAFQHSKEKEKIKISSIYKMVEEIDNITKEEFIHIVNDRFKGNSKITFILI